MRLTNALGLPRLAMLIIAAVLFLAPLFSQLTAQPVQSATTPKYVKTAEDTVILSTTSGFEKTVTVYNHSDSINLLVYSGDETGKITNSFLVIPPKKHVKFHGKIMKIYRHAAKDSVYSQVIQGDVEFGLNNSCKVNQITAGRIRAVMHSELTTNCMTSISQSELKGTVNGEADIIRKMKFPLPASCRIQVL